VTPPFLLPLFFNRDGNGTGFLGYPENWSPENVRLKVVNSFDVFYPFLRLRSFTLMCSTRID